MLLVLCGECQALVGCHEVFSIGILGQRTCDGCLVREPPLQAGTVASRLHAVRKDVVVRVRVARGLVPL